jgi:hypothetical protein
MATAAMIVLMLSTPPQFSDFPDPVVRSDITTSAFPPLAWYRARKHRQQLLSQRTEIQHNHKSNHLSAPLYWLPVELLEHTASHLEGDVDVCTLIRTCKHTGVLQRGRHFDRWVLGVYWVMVRRDGRRVRRDEYVRWLREEMGRREEGRGWFW